jgi:hypothetical protein
MKLTKLQKSILGKLVWDYDIPPEDLFAVIMGKKEKAGGLSRTRILARLFERIFWYDILKILSLEQVKDFLGDEVIRLIRNPDIRNRYEYVSGILHKKNVSLSGWNPENRKGIQSTLLSNRWYRAQ